MTSPSSVKSAGIATPMKTDHRCDGAYGKVLRAELMSYCELGNAVGPVGMATAPWKASEPEPQGTILVVVEPDATTVDGMATAPTDLAALLDNKGQVARMVGAAPGPWALAVAADAPMSRLVSVVNALVCAGKLEGRLVLTVPSEGGVAKPRDGKQLAAIHGRVHRPEPADKAMRLAQEVSDNLPMCGGLIQAFDAVAHADPAMKCRILAAGASEGLIACGCRNLDETLTLLYAIMAGTTVPTSRAAYVAVRLDPTARAVVVRPEAKWSTVVASLERKALGGLNLVLQ